MNYKTPIPVFFLMTVKAQEGHIPTFKDFPFRTVKARYMSSKIFLSGIQPAQEKRPRDLHSGGFHSKMTHEITPYYRMHGYGAFSFLKAMILNVSNHNTADI